MKYDLMMGDLKLNMLNDKMLFSMYESEIQRLLTRLQVSMSHLNSLKSDKAYAEISDDFVNALSTFTELRRIVIKIEGK
jgi:hypothetical protein